MMSEKEEIKRELEKLKKDLSDYLRIAPLIGITDKEKERVTNQFLEDIQKRLEKLK